MANIQKRGDTYRISVSCGYSENGKQIRKTTTFVPPEKVTESKAKKLAEVFAFEFEKKCRGATNLNENMRFSELAEWYFENIAPSKLKEITIYGNKKMLDLYVMPVLGHLKLKDINTGRLDELFHQLSVDGGIRKSYSLIDVNSIPNGTCKATARLAGVSFTTMYTATRGGHISEEMAIKIAVALEKKLSELFYVSSEKGGLEASTVKRIATTTSSVFATAKKKDIISKNPVTNSTTPKIEQKNKPFLDESQCKQLIEILEQQGNEQLKTALITLLYTGFRVGELLALHWSDIDFENGIIAINHTLVRVNGQYKLSTPKTKTSERILKVPEELLEMLVEHHQWQDGQRSKYGSLWVDRGAVFTGECGEYHNRTYMNTLFQEITKKYNFPKVTIHDLRHANASLLIHAGLPTKVISDHLGHRNTQTTENIYAHVFNSARAKASEAISLALKK